jgi:hypothetical protein
MTTFNEIFKKLDENKFDDSNCFLCGTDLHENNRSQEHVIPKWIQRRFNLWNQKIILLNGSSIDYRYLTIPCCKNCNNKYLKRLEDKLINAIDSGFDSLKKLDRNIIFYWLGKIYFGLMYKELFLHLNQKNHEEGTIINSDYIKRFEAHYLFLQGIR